ANDRWRQLLRDTIHQDRRMLPAGGYSLSDFIANSLLNLGSFQETDVPHPGDIDDHAQAMLLGLIQQRNGWDRIGENRIDPSSTHEREIHINVGSFRELITLAVWRESPIRGALDVELLAADVEKFALGRGTFKN